MTKKTSEIRRFVPVRPRALLARVLEDSSLVTAVRALPPEALRVLVHEVGLEDSGELVALATPEQLAQILDADVWTSKTPGGDEDFDAERFALWLEVLLEAGDDAVAGKLVALPEELVTLGLLRQIVVLDMDALALEISAMDPDDADALEKALEGGLSQEIDAYRVVSRRHEGWDSVLAVLLALDKDHHDYLTRVLERLCEASKGLFEDAGGLTAALNDAEQIASDAAAEREDRRAAEGYVAPAHARGVLALARSSSVEEVLAETTSDALTRAYFRELSATPRPPTDTAAARPLLTILRNAGVPLEAPPELLAPAGGRAKAKKAEGHGGPIFRDAMGELARRNRAAYAKRLEELAYLVNVLVAGSSTRGRAYRPIEAVEAAIAACAIGLLRWLAAPRAGGRASENSGDAAAVLAGTAADRLFRVGYRVLHDAVAMPTVRAMHRALLDRKDPVGSAVSAREIVERALADDKPWLALAALERDEWLASGRRGKTLAALLEEIPALPHGDGLARIGSLEQLSRAQRALRATFPEPKAAEPKGRKAARSAERAKRK